LFLVYSKVATFYVFFLVLLYQQLNGLWLTVFNQLFSCRLITVPVFVNQLIGVFFVCIVDNE